MHNYIIITDSGCDIDPITLQNWGVARLNLFVQFDGEDVSYEDGQIPVKEFYEKMRQGGVAKTSAISIGIFEEAFEAHLQAGRDVLYLGFSGGLSTTYNSGRIAAEQLAEQYPDRKIITVDTLAASAGLGMLVCFAARKQKEGASIDEVAAWVEENKLHMAHWVTVDTLTYLKRGGRVSATTAFFGNTLGIKPLIHVDNEGHLINVGKSRGRKKGLSDLVDNYARLALEPEQGELFVCHSDCLDDVLALEGMLNERFGQKFGYIADIGAVVGAHTGPGTIALFFLAKER